MALVTFNNEVREPSKNSKHRDIRPPRGLICFSLQVEIYGDGIRPPLVLRDWALVDYEHIWQQGTAYGSAHCIVETCDQLKQAVYE